MTVARMAWRWVSSRPMGLVREQGQSLHDRPGDWRLHGHHPGGTRELGKYGARLFNRGNAYRNKGQDDRAIQHYARP